MKLFNMEDNDIKQVMVIRKDLNMRKGKLAAQVAHGSMKVFFENAMFHEEYMVIRCTKGMLAWAQGIFTKIVVYVESEQVLFELKTLADELGVPNALVLDAGKTEFKEPTYTCLAVGPDIVEVVNEITGDLPLM